MKIGYMPDTHGGPYEQPEPSPEAAAQFCDQLLNEGIEAEQAGFDGIFLPERHHRTETMFPPPLVMLAGYATRTERVDLGTFVLQTPYYNPMHLAEDVAMIDLMSKGRVILGVGLGYHPDYFRLFNEPYKQRFSRFEESLDIMRLAWSSHTPFSYHGKRFEFDHVMLTPKPYQAGGPPLWIGAAYPEAIKRAGRLGDAWGILPFWDPIPNLQAQAALYRESAAKLRSLPQSGAHAGWLGRPYPQRGRRHVWAAVGRRDALLLALETPLTKRRVHVGGGFHGEKAEQIPGHGLAQRMYRTA